MTHRRSLLSLPACAFLLTTRDPRCGHRRRAMLFLVLVAGALLAANPVRGQIGLAKTGQTTKYYPGDDGDLRKGVAWPSPRFKDLGDGTVMDRLTGLLWLQRFDCPKLVGFDTADGKNDGEVSWQRAMDFTDKVNQGEIDLNLCGVKGAYHDWRLPNVLEAASLSDAETFGYYYLRNRSPFRAVPQWDGLWTSTPHFGSVACGGFLTSELYPLGAKTSLWVLLVRGTTHGPAPVRKTGFKFSCRPGDDGGLQMGVAWPEPRFKDLGDGTAQDRLTGLVWPIRSDCLSATGFAPDDKVTWQRGLDFIATVNKGKRGLGRCGVTKSYKDWRMPNDNELLSLVDFSEVLPPLPRGTPLRVNTEQTTGYWISTTYALSTPGADMGSMHDPYFWARTKSSPAFLLMVRGPLPVQ